MIENNSEQPDEVSLDLSTGRLLILSVVSANVYVFFSLLIVRYWHEGNFYNLFLSETGLWTQIAFGTGAGIGASLIIYLCIQIKSIKEVLSDFMIFEALSKAKFTFFDRTQLSIFAGAGEEVLFRGAIQPILGNSLTSIIFIGIHGYFKFKSPAHIFFGVMMFGLSFMLGLLSEHIGLIAAMTAHALYDLFMLIALQRKN
jgi:membrane protease YdiL (CAAX protease family)